MVANVLGEKYEVCICSVEEDPNLEGQDGYCDTSTKRIVVDSMETPGPNSKGDLKAYQRSVIRHELIHAFLYESGLDSEVYWAKSEDMVDWIAIQLPKLMKTMQEAGALDA